MLLMYFITWNQNKFIEVQSIIHDIQKLDIELPEIQDIDAQKIIEAKLFEAKKHYDGDFFVEDTSLYLSALNWLPWPLIKWFLQELWQQWIYNIVEKLWDFNATAKTIIGYMDKQWTAIYFIWEIQWTIVEPLVATNFGWDSLFQPLWSAKTFAAMSAEEKRNFSMRKIAVEKLKAYII